ncbi:MAG: hypothetical protein KJ042_17235 [Deltaproteobacteria bacterium]|nr:hypothetical protein [Deltaproteobacteria bacterium]
MRVHISLLKRVIFALIPSALLLVAATVAVRGLEATRAIDTTRADDRAKYPPVDLLSRKSSLSGPVWVVNRSGSINESRVPVEKRAGDWRVLVVGESFAKGSPWADYYEKLGQGHGGIPDWIAAETAMRCPSVNVQMINAGSGAASSGVVLGIARELMVTSPDLMIVMCGNNEGFVDRTRLGDALQEWALYRALKKGILPEPTRSHRPYFTPQDDDTQKIRDHYERNIRDMVATAREAGVTPVLATLPINVKYPREGTIRPEDSAWPEDDAAIVEGQRRQYQDGDCPGAIEAYLRSPNEAWAARYIGECLERMNRTDDAREMLRVYVENMPQNRIRPSMNDFVRRLARDENLVLVDLERHADDLSPTGITSPDLFVDFCHMTWRGYYLMAREILRVLWERELVPHAAGEPRPNPSIEEIIDANGWQRLREVGDRRGG